MNANSGNKRFYKKAELKFQLHDSARKGVYSYHQIHDAIIIKVQTTLYGGRFVFKSLMDTVKSGSEVPVRGQSQKVDNLEKMIEQESFNRKYKAQLAHYFSAESNFEDNWIKAYGLIYNTYCGSKLQLAIKQKIDYESRIRDNPLALLEEIEKLMHVPRRA